MEKELTPVPLGERVIVEPVVPAQEGELYMPESMPKPTQGIVMAVSDEVTTLRKGDLVQFYEGAGIPLIMNDKGYLIMRTGDLICKFIETK